LVLRSGYWGILERRFALDLNRIGTGLPVPNLTFWSSLHAASEFLKQHFVTAKPNDMLKYLRRAQKVAQDAKVELL
jgi:hypothetical protein